MPPLADRDLFPVEDDALGGGYTWCGVCFVPTPVVSDYETERSLAMFSLQQVRATYYPYADSARQADIKRIGARVLDEWPVSLKGYRYRFQIVDGDDINAFAESSTVSSFCQKRQSNHQRASRSGNEERERGLSQASGRVKEMKYLIIIEKDGRGCSAYVPDLPGCVAAGNTEEEVRELIHEGIQLHLKGMRETGDSIPEPTSTAEYVEAAS